MFLSTPPSRVATPLYWIAAAVPSCFYPRHPRGWRQGVLCAAGAVYAFLSTPPSRVATGGQARCVLTHMFLSTPPSRVATSQILQHLRIPESFYPRHPRGWRQHAAFRAVCRRHVSIHATLAGGDRVVSDFATPSAVFLSTPPSRVATSPVRILSENNAFLSTPPSRVATAKVYKNVQSLLRKREKIICKIKNNLKHPPHIPIATSKKCTACPKTSDGIGAKLLGKVCLLSPRTGAATQAAHHPEQIRGGGQGAPRGFCSGCQAGKSAGCRFRGQSARPARL